MRTAPADDQSSVPRTHIGEGLEATCNCSREADAPFWSPRELTLTCRHTHTCIHVRVHTRVCAHTQSHKSKANVKGN